MIDTIRATRDETDYDFRDSLVKKEFMRKWSHSRTNVGAMLSLEQLMEDAPDSITSEMLHLRKRSLRAGPLKHLPRLFQNGTSRYFS